MVRNGLQQNGFMLTPLTRLWEAKAIAQMRMKVVRGGLPLENVQGIQSIWWELQGCQVTAGGAVMCVSNTFPFCLEAFMSFPMNYALGPSL